MAPSASRPPGPRISSPNRSRLNRLGVRGGWRRCPSQSPSARRSRVGERAGRRLVDEHARSPRSTTVSSAPPRAEGDDRPAAGLRLERHDAEILFARQQGDRRAVIGGRGSPRSDSRPANSTSAPGRRARAARAPDRRRRWSAGTPRPAAGLDGEVQTLVGHQRRHHEARRSGDLAGRLKELGVDRRIHHSRPAIIVSADPPRNILGNRHIAVRTVRPWPGPTGPAGASPAA